MTAMEQMTDGAEVEPWRTGARAYRVELLTTKQEGPARGSSKRVKQEGQARESSKRSSEKSRPDESWTLQRGVATESSMQVIDVERRHCQINPDERALDR